MHYRVAVSTKRFTISEWKENLFKCSIYIEYKTKYSRKLLERIAFPLTENQIFLCIFFDRFTSSVSVQLLRTIALYSKQDIVCAQLYRYLEQAKEASVLQVYKTYTLLYTAHVRRTARHNNIYTLNGVCSRD